MYCMKCQNDVSECTCPDIVERLAECKEHPNLHIAICPKCRSLKAFCKCVVQAQSHKMTFSEFKIKVMEFVDEHCHDFMVACEVLYIVSCTKDEDEIVDGLAKLNLTDVYGHGWAVVLCSSDTDRGEVALLVEPDTPTAWEASAANFYCLLWHGACQKLKEREIV